MSQFESAFEEKFYNERLEKLTQIRALGVKAGLTEAEAIYPNTFRFTHTLTASIAGVPALLPLGVNADSSPKPAEQLESEHIEASIAGRLVAIRLQGKAGFATLQQNGARLQIYVRKDDVGEDAFDLYKLLDLGDHIGVTGYLMRTRTGELTLKVHAAEGKQPITFLTKAMLPLPDKYAGLGDIELRYRRRYLDLFTDTGDFAEATSDEAVKGTGSDEAVKGTGSEAALKGTGSEAALKGTGSDEAVKGTGSEAALKGTGFSPSIHDEGLVKGTASAVPQQVPGADGALAPEGAPAKPTQTRLPAREVFVKRAAILRSIRNFFDTRGYLEVETPMLHTVAGGAAARPFSTHHNALDIPLSLRIAPELYLKRLVVGGFDRVYEINRNFRNEGVSTSHNPEFTMLEFYQAYANYHDLMDLTEELIKFVAMEVNGSYNSTFNGVEIDLSEWTKLRMIDAIPKFWPEEFGPVPTLEELGSRERFLKLLHRTVEAYMPIWEASSAGADPKEMFLQDSSSSLAAAIRNMHKKLFTSLTGLVVEMTKGASLGKGIALLFEVVGENPFAQNLIQPTIIYDFPLAVSPLSKVKPDEPDWVERFEFYIGGFEVGNAFSELNDPADQLARFEAQVADKDPESMAAVDEDYVRALGYGLPPTAGEGIGIDRLTMILTGSRSIRDVILFPLMRPQKPTELTEPTE